MGLRIGGVKYHCSISAEFKFEQFIFIIYIIRNYYKIFIL